MARGQEIQVHLRAKLPRWYHALVRLIRVAGWLGWKPSAAAASRIGSWVAKHTDVEVVPVDPDKKTQGLDGLP